MGSPDASNELARPPVVVVGGGMAGLTAAAALHEAGVPVLVFEAADAVGGRLRTRVTPEGFLIDRGFQVALAGYPTAGRWLDYRALQPGSFDAGALMWTGRRLVPLADPIRHPTALVRDLTTSLFNAGDKLRLAMLAAEAAAAPWQSANEAATSLGHDVTAAEYLWSRGFSERFVDRFARPFWGGVTLDPHLAGSAGPLLVTLKMFLRAPAILPARGIGALPKQIASRLPQGSVVTNAQVTSVVTEGGRATGVIVDERAIPARAVIVATDPPTALSLSGAQALASAAEGVPSVTVYLAGQHDPGTGPRLVLDATRELLVNHLASLSVVQPGYAPEGQHLIAAAIVGEAATSDDVEALADRARFDATTMLKHAPGMWRVIDVVRESFAQFAQPPGIYRRLPGNVTPTRGLVLATEATVDSSYNGAMLSGETAAAIVQRELAFEVES